MVKRKKSRMRGKLRLSQYFQNLKDGDCVAIIRERSLQAKFPLRLQGRTGIVEGKRGKSYIIKISDQNKEKRFLIDAIHIKKVVK